MSDNPPTNNNTDTTSSSDSSDPSPLSPSDSFLPPPSSSSPCPLPSLSSLLTKDLSLAEKSKEEGNQYYSLGQYEEAINSYSQSIVLCPDQEKSQLSIFYNNRGAGYMMMNQYLNVINDCSFSLINNNNNIKALFRRSSAYEKNNQPDLALEDNKKILVIDENNDLALKNIERLRVLVDKKNEEMKEEMVGKLKDLGNGLLGKFGLSLDNFKATKDPNSGSYSINFQK